VDGSGDFSTGDPFCVQKFKIDEGLEFDPYQIKWPLHYDGSSVIGINLECDEEGEIEKTEGHRVAMNEVFNCSVVGVDDEPYWCPEDCGLVGVNYELDTIRASDACFKLIKRWTIVDWCIYESNDSNEDLDEFLAIEDWAINECYTCAYEDFGNAYFKYKQVDVDGYYTFNQIIKVVDDVRPTISAEEEIVVIIDADNNKTEFETCEAKGMISASATDFCGDSEIGGKDLKWLVLFYMDDELVSEQTSYGAEIVVETPSGKIGEELSVEWRAIDLCGNISTAYSTIIFNDQRAPTPYCITGLTTAIDYGESTVTIWANEFDFGSFDECSSSADLIWSIVPAGQEPLSPDHEDFEKQQSITFDCQEDQLVQDLDAYVWDESGNSDFCRVNIILDADGDCIDNTGSSGTIAGSISTTDGRAISGASVLLSSSATQEYPKTINTDVSGEFIFVDNPKGFNYQLSAKKSDNYINGISTLDIVMASRHIIGLNIMDNPYKIIAGDVNGDESLSAADLVELRKLVLGKSQELPMPAWQFVKKEQTFFNSQKPWPYINTIEIDDLQGDQLTEDLIGIKIGDLNQNVLLNDHSNSENRSQNTHDFFVTDYQINKAEVVRIPFYSESINEVYGMQLGFNLSQGHFEGIESGLMEMTEENIGLINDELTISWHNPYSLDIQEDDVLFYITVRADDKTNLRNLLKLSSYKLIPELYSSSLLDISIPVINYINEPEQDIILYQNYPNPFVASTTIEILIPNDFGVAEFSIHTIQGKLIYTNENRLKSGLNRLVIPSHILEEDGTYFYSIKTEKTIITKQMLSLGTDR